MRQFAEKAAALIEDGRGFRRREHRRPWPIPAWRTTRAERRPWCIVGLAEQSLATRVAAKEHLSRGRCRPMHGSRSSQCH